MNPCITITIKERVLQELLIEISLIAEARDISDSPMIVLITALKAVIFPSFHHDRNKYSSE
jgi:hypothetical protein